MKRLLENKTAKWLLAPALLLVLAACNGADPVVDTHTLTVTTTGEGTVTSEPEGIDCGEDCTHDFNENEEVTLTATPAVTGDAIAWGNAGATCTGDTCTVTMDAAKTVSVTFGEDDGGNGGGVPVDELDEDYRSAVSENGAEAGEVGPQLTVNFTAGGVDDSVSVFASQDVEELLEASADDEVRYPVGHTFESSDLDLGFDPTHGSQVIGIFFPDVAIPADATVTGAVITFEADGGNTGSFTVELDAEASVTPEAFVTDADEVGGANLTSRTTLGTPVSWTITDAWTVDDMVDSDDISTLVQALVDMDGWESGASDIVILISPTAADNGPA